MPHQFKKEMDAIAPHPGWHGVFLRQLSQSKTYGWVLRGKKKKKSHYVHQAGASARKTKPATDLVCLIDLIIGGQCISPPPRPGQHRSREPQLSTALLLSDESLVVGISNVVARCLGLVQTLAQ